MYLLRKESFCLSFVVDPNLRSPTFAYDLEVKAEAQFCDKVEHF